ncbi:hypothetical protein [uncultured Aliiroseovarius sp.]|uniref:hypothetical protein n=2 Tax=Aliiroseovarius TaxID=1658781 RepID=UPI00259365E3|nr:hypothetical protein [uncultured Aliiroseovarius sp.]
MMARLPVFALALLIATGDLAHAGAWPRDKGDAFASGQLRIDAHQPDRPPDLSVYGEYGLTDQWTVGGKLEYERATKNITDIKAFGRWHVPDQDGPWQKALGVSVEGTPDAPFVTPSMHLGRGVDTPLGPGWLDVQMTAKTSILNAQADFGAFGLFGVKPFKRLMTMMALDVSAAQGGPQADVIPSLAWQYMPGQHLSVEWTHAIAGAVKDQVAVGLWLEF